MASRTPASANSGMTSGPRAGIPFAAGAVDSFFCRPRGGIERDGTWTAGRACATCLVGSGDGIGTSLLGRGLRTGTCTVEAFVARAGVVARARLTVDLDGAFDGFRDAVLAVFFLVVRSMRVLLLLTIQSDISKAFAESNIFFVGPPEMGHGCRATPL